MRVTSQLDCDSSFRQLVLFDGAAGMLLHSVSITMLGEQPHAHVDADFCSPQIGSWIPLPVFPLQETIGHLCCDISLS